MYSHVKNRQSSTTGVVETEGNQEVGSTVAERRAALCSNNWDDGRDEMNLIEFPLSSVADRFPGGRKTVVFSDQVWDRDVRQHVACELAISGSDRYGLPTAKDEDVLLGCLQLTRQVILRDYFDLDGEKLNHERPDTKGLASETPHFRFARRLMRYRAAATSLEGFVQQIA